ncbi:MAG: tetratricopeptide repeat protein [Myxococcota bacterium]
MTDSCPSDSTLQAFASGGLDADARAATALHVSGCARCQAAFLPIALQASATRQTAFDSPRAKARRDSHDLPLPPGPEAVTDPGTQVADPMGLEDTHVSDERLNPLSAPSLNKGQSLDRYVILERLGAGGMGEVYAAWDPALDRKVAVKILRPELLQDDPDLTDQLKTRMIREAQALARLSHPNVVAIHDVGVAGPHIFLAMEFVAGKTLKAWLTERPRSWRSILEIFLAAGEGLAAAHAVGITHRDFKPDNVVVGADGRVRVMDFGLAHAHQETARREVPLGESDSPSAIKRAITQPGAMLGTPAYMSPEALYGRPTDFRSDEYSFCAALFEALYGLRPFSGETPAAIAAEMEAGRLQPAPRNTPVPRRVHQLIVRGLEIDPARRFQTMRALLIQLGRRKSMLRRRALTALAVATVALAAGVVGLVTHRERTRCADVEQRLAGVWDARSKQAIRDALLASGKPWASTAWRDVESRLDAYSRQWVALRRQACETRAGENDEALGQHLVCLSRCLADLQAVSRLLSRPEPEMAERAVATASALPPLAACTAVSPRPRARGPEHEEALAQLAAIKASFDAARYAEALADAETLATRSSSTGDLATLAEARLLAASSKARLGDTRAADLAVEEAILLAENALDDELEARAWVERVGIAAVAGSPDADRWVRFARAAVSRTGSPRDLEASLANNVGVLAYLQGRFDEAVAAHEQALKLRAALLGERHPLVARTHSNLGTALRAQGHLDEAAGEYRRALAIEEEVLDPTHPAVAETLNNLANVLQQRGELAAAKEAHERALKIKEAAFGADSLAVALSLTNLAAVLLDQGDVTGAVAALRRSLELKERLAGRDALTVAITLTNLAQAQRRLGDWSASTQLDRRALQIRRARQGNSHPDLAYNLTGLGQAELELGHAADAKAALEEALALRTAQNEQRAETAVALARVLLRTKGGTARATALLEDAVAATPHGSPLQLEAQALLTKHPKR